MQYWLISNPKCPWLYNDEKFLGIFWTTCEKPAVTWDRTEGLWLQLSVLYQLSHGHWVTACLHLSYYCPVCAVICIPHYSHEHAPLTSMFVAWIERNQTRNKNMQSQQCEYAYSPRRSISLYILDYKTKGLLWIGSCQVAVVKVLEDVLLGIYCNAHELNLAPCNQSTYIHLLSPHPCIKLSWAIFSFILS